MNRSLKKRSNRLTQRSNRLTKRNNRLTKRINRLTKRINRLTKRSKRSKRNNRLTKRSKRNNRLTKRNNRLSKRREIYGGAVKTLTKTNDETTYYELQLGDEYILVTIKDINNLSEKLRELYSGTSCFLEKGKFNWEELLGYINMIISSKSDIELKLKTLEEKIQELNDNYQDIGPKCRVGFFNTFATFKESWKDFYSSIQSGKLLKYTVKGKTYLFDPLDIQNLQKIGITHKDLYDPEKGDTVEISDPKKRAKIAIGKVARIASSRGHLNGDCTVEWRYITPPSGITKDTRFTTNFLSSALKKLVSRL